MRRGLTPRALVRRRSEPLGAPADIRILLSRLRSLCHLQVSAGFCLTPKHGLRKIRRGEGKLHLFASDEWGKGFFP